MPSRHSTRPKITDITKIDVSDINDNQVLRVKDNAIVAAGLNTDQVKTTVLNSHIKDMDQYFDRGGVNEVSAVQVKDAVTKSHTQGTDQGLDTGGPNATTAAQVKTAVTNSHIQATDQYLDFGGPNQVSAAQILAGLNGIKKLVIVTGDYSVLPDDNVLVVNLAPFTPAVTITMPVGSNGRELEIYRVDNEPITVSIAPQVGDAVITDTVIKDQKIEFHYVASLNAWGDFAKKIYNNPNATTPPTTAEDSTAGYSNLSLYLNTASGQVSVSTDASNGSWAPITQHDYLNYEFADSPISITEEHKCMVLIVDKTGGNVDVFLPAAASFDGFWFIVRTIGSIANNVSIVTTGGELIEGATDINVPHNSSYKVLSANSEWVLII